MLQQLTMNEEEDEFLVEPEEEELKDIVPIAEPPSPTHKHQPQSQKQPHLKMIQIPKPETVPAYKPFRLQVQQESDQQSEDTLIENAPSALGDFYNPQQCVYQRHDNSGCNRVGENKYFAGCFLPRSLFQEGSHSQTSDISLVVREYQEEEGEITINKSADNLAFDSHFEGGNLFAAFKVGDSSYELLMSNDTNSTGSNQWFYFSVSGMRAHREYTFSIINFTKSDSLFNYGMLPAVYSMAANSHKFDVEKGWHRAGTQVSYKKGRLLRQNSRRYYYQLNFCLSTVHEKDTLLVAHSYPYSFEKLNKYIAERSVKYKDVVTRSQVGKTTSKRSIQCLVVGQGINKKRDNRKAVVVLARQHPGQTQGSYVCEGFIDKLLAKGIQGEFLLKNYVFYVIPMVNPDGVVFGHYRCNLSGKDLNRKWDSSERDSTCPEITAIKNFIQTLSQQRQIRFVLDLHGHSKKLGSFFYGNPSEMPEVSRIFPFVCSRLHPGIDFRECTFTIDPCKRRAARVHLSTSYRLPHVYTFQSSFYGYSLNGKQVEFTPKQYRDLGGALCSGLHLQLDHELRYQQAYEFSLKKFTQKDIAQSNFLKFLSELMNNKGYLVQGEEVESGSESRPDEGEVNMDEIQGRASEGKRIPSPVREIRDNESKTTKISRKGGRDVKQYAFTKPTRNIRFLQITKINSVLPDRYQLGLQPIRKKDTTQSAIKTGPTYSIAEAQTEMKGDVQFKQFRTSDIEICSLANSWKPDQWPERKFSSLSKANRHFIFRFQLPGNITSREEPYKPVPHTIRNAFSQTMVSFPRQDKLRSNQLPLVQSTDRTPKKESEFYFRGMMRKLMYEKQISRSEQLSTKFILQKPLSVKKKDPVKK